MIRGRKMSKKFPCGCNNEKKVERHWSNVMKTSISGSRVSVSSPYTKHTAAIQQKLVPGIVTEQPPGIKPGFIIGWS